MGAWNRLDLEELASFDRDTGSSASMLGSSGDWRGRGLVSSCWVAAAGSQLVWVAAAGREKPQAIAAGVGRSCCEEGKAPGCYPCSCAL